MKSISRGEGASQLPRHSALCARTAAATARQWYYDDERHQTNMPQDAIIRRSPM